ncbi:hypothetical protein GCM10010987_64060 [Bradyrhizobium guangdongense]|uniref:Uncharacterized protein n=1 Tax=Bradyrhizobium guangdongense TaxID=1325090 RepID=A0AA88BBG6_9BRAD|nr:hypothetical protein GCM10010987_64060 [Bradyrhizobium guangdongense]
MSPVVHGTTNAAPRRSVHIRYVARRDLPRLTLESGKGTIFRGEEQEPVICLHGLQRSQAASIAVSNEISVSVQEKRANSAVNTIVNLSKNGFVIGR